MGNVGLKLWEIHLKGASMLETLHRLGVTSSFSHPRVSSYAESLFRTCKYRPDYPAGGFATINEASIPESRRENHPTRVRNIRITGARGNNCKGISLDLYCQPC